MPSLQQAETLCPRPSGVTKHHSKLNDAALLKSLRRLEPLVHLPRTSKPPATHSISRIAGVSLHISWSLLSPPCPLLLAMHRRGAHDDRDDSADDAQAEGGLRARPLVAEVLEGLRHGAVYVGATHDAEDSWGEPSEDLRPQRPLLAHVPKGRPRPRGSVEAGGRRGAPRVLSREQAALQARLHRVERVRQRCTEASGQDRRCCDGCAIGHLRPSRPQPRLQRRCQRNVRRAEDAFSHGRHGETAEEAAEPIRREYPPRRRPHAAAAVLLVHFHELEGRLHQGRSHSGKAPRDELVSV
mmetsp:Transcript_21534/g.73818  ORF Transcript_21534/g.73818 Transcript_21534/m.73818 type:complete len:298 (-) Transcript_21534:380-1273(-)